MIWGCMTAQGVGKMCEVEGTMDAPLYTKILDNNILQSTRALGIRNRDFLFQQDNDPKHASGMAGGWFKDHKVKVMEWPPQSPDLNPIEHLWIHLKRKLNGYETYPRGMQELLSRIEREWDRVPAEVCKNLVNSMPRRLEAVIKAKGGSTKY
jgi:transposase